MTFTFEGEHPVLVEYQDDHQKYAMSRMCNPPHPGEVLREWLPENMTVTQAAKDLQISRFDLWQAEQQPAPEVASA
ncbi:MAG: transcriptional regulator [Thauera sp.]